MLQSFKVDRNLQRATFVNVFLSAPLGKLVVVSNQGFIPGDVHAVNLSANLHCFVAHQSRTYQLQRLLSRGSDLSLPTSSRQSQLKTLWCYKSAGSARLNFQLVNNTCSRMILRISAIEFPNLLVERRHHLLVQIEYIIRYPQEFIFEFGALCWIEAFPSILFKEAPQNVVQSLPASSAWRSSASLAAWFELPTLVAQKSDRRIGQRSQALAL